MNLKIGSIIAFGILLLGLFFLINNNYIFSKNPITIIIQIFAFAIMIWARITFGFRSFHASANSTKGRLITNGPYKWLRHPIYASIIYFFWACVIAYPNIETIGAVLLITLGSYARMLLEEKSLLETYEEYTVYCKRTKRIIPYLF